MNNEGWAWDDWGGIKMHYYRDRKSLCNRFEYPKFGPYQADYPNDLKCKQCMRKLEMEK